MIESISIKKIKVDDLKIIQVECLTGSFCFDHSFLFTDKESAIKKMNEILSDHDFFKE